MVDCPSPESACCQRCSKPGHIVVDWLRDGWIVYVYDGALAADESPAGGPAVWTCQGGCQPTKTVTPGSLLDERLDQVVATEKAKPEGVRNNMARYLARLRAADRE